mgnify:CR=1 FL=1
MAESSQDPPVPFDSVRRRRRRASQDVGRRRVGDQTGESVGDVVRVAERAEQCVDAPDGHGREEGLEIEPDQHVGSHVRPSGRDGRSTADEAVCGVVGRNRGEHLTRHRPLQVRQDGLGCLDEAERPRAAAMPAVPVVAHGVDRGRPLERAGVDVPHEVGRPHSDEIGQVASGVEFGDTEPHGGAHRAAHRGPRCATERHD